MKREILNKTIRTVVILFSFSLFLFTSCLDNLDIDQHGVLNRDTYYQTDDDARAAMTAVYAEIITIEWHYKSDKNLLSDDHWAGTDFHGGGYWDVNDYIFDGSNSLIAPLFTRIYNVVGKCNALLDNVKGETTVQQQMIAEAKVVRAWMYFELTTLWGNPPLVDHVLSTTESAQPNADPKELYAFMEKDLTDAIDSDRLSEKSSVDDRTNYRITKQYAQAVLGKVYLWNSKAKEAAEVFDAVINSGKYALFTGEYGDIHSVKNENNSESLFESNIVVDNANPGSALHFYTVVAGLRSSQWNFGDNELGFNTWGIGAFVPKKSLYDAFVAEEGMDGYRLNQTIVTLEQMNAHGYEIKSTERMMSEGLFRWKTRTEQEAAGLSYPYDNGSNIRWMRYAEVLLLAAEANLAAGNQSKADSYLNEVRTRAKLAPKTVTLDAIKLEKRLELCGECVRFQDLVRWDDAYETLKNQGENAPWLNPNGTVEYQQFNKKDYGFKKGKHERLPYPTSEMRVNRNLIQNPGWN